MAAQSSALNREAWHVWTLIDEAGSGSRNCYMWILYEFASYPHIYQSSTRLHAFQKFRPFVQDAAIATPGTWIGLLIPPTSSCWSLGSGWHHCWSFCPPCQKATAPGLYRAAGSGKEGKASYTDELWGMRVTILGYTMQHPSCIASMGHVLANNILLFPCIVSTDLDLSTQRSMNRVMNRRYEPR